jgi:hypothetical protein
MMWLYKPDCSNLIIILDHPMVLPVLLDAKHWKSWWTHPLNVERVETSGNTRSNYDRAPVQRLEPGSTSSNPRLMKRPRCEQVLMGNVNSRHGARQGRRHVADVTGSDNKQMQMYQGGYDHVASLIPPSIAKPLEPSKALLTIFSPYAMRLGAV